MNIHSRTNIASFLTQRLRRFTADQSGAAAVIAAILFPVVIGGLGLGAETGYWYMTQRKLQHMADVSAHAGAIRRRYGSDIEAVREAAVIAAAGSGYSGTPDGLAVNMPYNGDGMAVEARLQYEVPRLFSSLFTDEPLVLSARAVAKVQGAGIRPCVLALSPDASPGVDVGGSTEVLLDGCDLAARSNASPAINFRGEGGGMSITNGCAYAVGGADGFLKQHDADCTEVRKLQVPPADPYAGLEHPPESYCNGISNGLSSMMWNDMHVYCYDKLALKADVLHSDSVYIVTGELSMQDSAELNATNVSFVLNGTASLKMNANANVKLHAPTSGPLAGVLFSGYQDGGKDVTINGNSGSVFDGAVYFPNSDIRFNGSSSGGCTSIIGNTVEFTGNSAMTCVGSADRETDFSNSVVSLIE